MFAKDHHAGGRNSGRQVSSLVQSATVAIHSTVSGNNQLGRRAFFMPKASALRFHQSNGSTARAEPCWRSGISRGFCVTAGLPPIASEPTPSPRLWATSPSATPVRLCEHTMGFTMRTPKPELSTWPGIGTFYLAPTTGKLFLLPADSRGLDLHLGLDTQSP